MTRGRSIEVAVKRVYDPPARSDGCRVLVDRLWPRGLSKSAAKLDAWIKELAPSDELRAWFGHDPAKWASFKRTYVRQLEQQGNVCERLLERCSHGTVTLLFAAKDREHNNAVALKQYLDTKLASER